MRAALPAIRTVSETVTTGPSSAASEAMPDDNEPELAQPRQRLRMTALSSALEPSAAGRASPVSQPLAPGRYGVLEQIGADREALMDRAEAEASGALDSERAGQSQLYMHL
ncbi:TPA: hypothetical protein ACH3X2_011069 [Trebouxia sp. C0005]